MMNYDVSIAAKKYMEHDMITAHTQLPEFPHKRIHLLYVFLKNGALASEQTSQKHQLFSLAISLIQMGLDTHDLVDTDNNTTEVKDMRSNQLRVLAGDFFSGRFYQLLAKKDQIEWIKHISKAIGEISRLKLDLYLKMQEKSMTIEELLEDEIRIKMQLFIPFSQMMRTAFSKRWFEILYGLTRCEVLVEHIKVGDETKHKLLSMLEGQLTKLKDQVHMLKCDLTFREFNDIVKPFWSYLAVLQPSERYEGS